MATFHDTPQGATGVVAEQPHFVSVKGAPDVVIDRCSAAFWKGDRVPIDQVRDEILTANRQLSEKGLRVLAFAYRGLADDDR